MLYVQEVDILYIWLSVLGKKGQDSSLNAIVEDKLSHCLGERNIYNGQEYFDRKFQVKTIAYF